MNDIVKGALGLLKPGDAVKLTLTVLQLALWLARYLQDKKVSDAAQLEQLRRQIKGALTMAQGAQDARNIALARDADPRKLRVDDGFKAPDDGSLGSSGGGG